MWFGCCTFLLHLGSAGCCRIVRDVIREARYALSLLSRLTGQHG